MARKFIDLGLPSGTLWATENEPGYHQYDEAVKTFSDMLPSAEAWEELFDQCGRKWNKRRKGYVLTGPNKNTLFLPAKGWQHWNEEGVYNVDGNGNYWSSTPNGKNHARCVYFNIGYVYPRGNDYRLDGFSVRLCKTK